MSTIEHKLDITFTAIVVNQDGELEEREEVNLADDQVMAFREICDNCFLEEGCELGEECAMYEDRSFRIEKGEIR